ncbi:MAG: hypothetical protein U9R74_11905 [Pseudomonadota bacterium]|nr:hypothetical protein [Pseudomonadota bacterium]
MIRISLPGVFALALLYATSPPAVAAKQDYCETMKGDTVVFVVDRTEVFDEQDQETFADGIGKLYDSLENGDHLVVHTIAEDHSASRRVFNQCKPGCPDLSLLDSLIGTCRESRARRDAITFQTDFLESVQPLIRNSEEHPGSAIIETIHTVSAEYGDAGVARMVIYSDLIENSRFGSFHSLSANRGKTTLERVKSSGQVPELKGTEVEVFGFGRNHGRNRKGLSPATMDAVRSFWEELFRTAGANSIDIHRYY